MGSVLLMFGGLGILTISAEVLVRNASSIALGNVIGSNIFNVLFILRACAVILPLTVGLQLVRMDVPIMIAVSAAAMAMALGSF